MYHIVMTICLMIGINSAHAESSSEALVPAISDAIKKIEIKNSTAIRREYAYQLSHMIAELPSDSIDNQTIIKLGALLEDQDDLIVGWTATSLGRIGPRAKHTIPALENALKKIECIYGSVTSEPAIRLALTKMGKNPPQRECPVPE